MEQNERIVYVTMNGCESSASISSNYMHFGLETSFEAPLYSFYNKDESNVSEATIHKLSSYYSSTLKSLSE